MQHGAEKNLKTKPPAKTPKERTVRKWGTSQKYRNNYDQIDWGVKKMPTEVDLTELLKLGVIIIGMIAFSLYFYFSGKP